MVKIYKREEKNKINGKKIQPQPTCFFLKWLPETHFCEVFLKYLNN